MSSEEKELKELMELIIQNRISSYYRHRKPYSSDQLKVRDQLEDDFETLMKNLPRDQEDLIRRHEQQILAECADEEVLYYRGGLSDGLHMKDFIEKLIKTN